MADIEKSIGFNTDDTDASHNSESHMGISRIKTSGDGGEFIHIGNTKVYKHELMEAFGGTLNPGMSRAPKIKLANPAPLGLAAFSLTTLCLSFVNVSTRGVENAKFVIGLAFFYGGVAQFAAGLFEIVLENTFGATALCSFGMFWCSWAAIETDAFGIASSYTDPQMLENAVGLFLMAWFIFTFLLMLCTIRSTVAFFGLFFFLDMTFLLLGIGALTSKHGVTVAGGWFGLVTSAFGFYNVFAGLANYENSFINVVPIYMPWAHRIDHQEKEKSS